MGKLGKIKSYTAEHIEHGEKHYTGGKGIKVNSVNKKSQVKFGRNYTSQPEHVELEKNKENSHMEWYAFF